MDKASQALTQSLPEGVPDTFAARAEHGEVALSTLYHRALGRRSREDKDQGQQYLDPWEEQALVNFLEQQDALGRSVRKKYVRSIAFSLACRRSPADRPSKPPGRNWPQLFFKRHPKLAVSKNGALDWNRFDIYDKVVVWFDVIGNVLKDPKIRPWNVFNMDETGIMLSKLNSVKVVVSKENNRGYRGARVKRTTVTAVECVSADGRYLNPMIIWPAAGHRANWVTHPTPGWHYAYSDTGYTDSYLSLQWLKLVFDPQTKERANGNPRVLINDGFATHETVEILQFCFDNNIILCRLPSHTSHKLQPCDISVFGPLKSFYRDEVERLERGCVGTIGKEHFAAMYSSARKQAFTSRNIRAGWAKAGLFPFNPDKVLSDIPKPLAELNSAKVNELTACPYAQGQIPQTPVTPVSPEALTSLLNMIKQVPDDEKYRQHKERLEQKHVNATRLSFAERAILQEHNGFLTKINNEGKVRRSTKSVKLGEARVMSFEDLERAKAERAAKEAAQEAKKAERAAKKAVKEANVATTGKTPRGRKRKSTGTEADGEPKAKVARISNTETVDTGALETSQVPAWMGNGQGAGPDAPEPKAPVAWMSDRQMEEGELIQLGSD